MAPSTPGWMTLVLFALFPLCGVSALTAAELGSTHPGRDLEAGNQNVLVEAIDIQVRQLQGGGPICEGGIPGIQKNDVCCPASCGTCAGQGCSSRDGGETFSGHEACCGGGVRSLNRVCSDTVGAPCVVSSGSTCEGGIPGIQKSDVCCPASCGTCAGQGCSSRDGGDTFSGQEACCGGGVRSLNRVCSDTVGAPCVVASGPTCEGGISGIQNNDVCCPASCGTCAGEGCSSRDGGDAFSGQEACCGGGVRSLNRVCSDTVGAPCVVPSGEGSTCEGGIPGIQKSDVCCPTSCGTCAGAGCSSRDGGEGFSGSEACCGGGVRSLNRVCSDTVGAPCVVSSGPTCEGGIPGVQNNDVCCPASCGTCAGQGCSSRDGGEDFSGQEACCGGGVRSLNRICSDTVGAPCVVSSDLATPFSWYFNGTEFTITETTAWGAVMSFEIPDSEGEVAELYLGTGEERPAAVRVGVELYRIEYDDDGEIVDIVLENSVNSRRALQVQSRARKDPQLPVWMSPRSVEGAMTSRITCDNCNDIINGVCQASGWLCGAKVVQRAIAIGSLIAILEGVSIAIVTRTIPVFIYACAAIKVLCEVNTFLGTVDFLETCEQIVCCERKRCGFFSCFKDDEERCCDDKLFPISSTCPTPAPIPAPTPAPTPAPKRGGNAGGDPRLAFYDGLGYHCHGQGEFVFTKIEDTSSEVQVRFQQWSQNPNPAVTVTTGVAAREGTSSLVQVTAATSGGLEVLVDGVPYDGAGGGVAGVSLEVTPPRVEMRFPSGLDVFVSIRTAGILRVDSYVPQTLATTGLLGNNNGEVGDDWQTADGDAIEFESPRGPTVEEGSNYCTTNWCTTQEMSIFTYTEGEDHGTYDLCDEVYVAPVLPEVAPPEIVQLCGDNAGCTFDALLAGEEVGRATIEEEEANRVYQEQVGGRCASNYFSSTGTPPCTACPAGEVSGTGATTCTREELLGLNIPANVAAAMIADAKGGFAGPGFLTGVPVGTIELTEADLGSFSLSGTFTRDDGAALASSTSVVFYIENAAQPDDFVRGQEALNPSTGEFRSVVTDLPTGSSRLFLSFVISDPDEALEGVEKGPDTVFALNVFNLRCVPPLTITLEWLDAVTDVDLYVTEPGGRLVYFGRKGGEVGTLDNDDTQGFGPENYVVSSGLDVSTSPVLGDYIARVNLFSGSYADWRLTSRVSGEIMWIEEGNLTSSSRDSADFTVSLAEYDSGCEGAT